MKSDERLGACSRARVIIATPDVIHTWLLPRPGQRGYDAIGSFLRGLSTIVVDEVHSYSGVFGSNAAFMYRRLLHVMSILGSSVTFVAASATMKNPDEHLLKLTGRNFTVVGPELDTSPRHPSRS